MMTIFFSSVNVQQLKQKKSLMEIKYKRIKLSQKAQDKRNKEILKLFNEGKNRREIAEQYKVSTQTIYDVINLFKGEGGK